ncbi:MAG TPA: hypothetical protein VN903_32905 [Polyangia bacterium]|jgi:hypothetical protein|nr:hypothetical protein [Polyangia bacterium]
MNKMLSLSLLSIAAMLLVPLRAQAQVLCALGPMTPYDPMADMPPSAGAKADVTKVTALLCPKGCGKVLLFANATTPNTATVTDGAGVSKIAYSPSFASSIRSNFGPIATFGIFAHGLGHHLDATGTKPAWMKEAWDAELRADAWAGCAMAKAELTPSRLQAALLAMSTYPSPHHPSWSARRAVITEGFTHCGGRILPPLAKEKAEQAAKFDGHKEEAVTDATPAPGGCTSDHDCRKGRACVNSHCAMAPERHRCGKDTDCPDPQECDSAGYCSGAGATQSAQAQTQTQTQAQAKDEPPPKLTGPMLAALQEPKTPAPPAKEIPACRQSCDDVRNQCIEAATNEANKCVAAIQSDPNYKACGCPNYPAGNVACYHVCAGAYQRGNTCSATNLVRDCRNDGDRCRAQCE